MIFLCFIWWSWLSVLFCYKVSMRVFFYLSIIWIWFLFWCGNIVFFMLICWKFCSVMKSCMLIIFGFKNDYRLIWLILCVILLICNCWSWMRMRCWNWCGFCIWLCLVGLVINWWCYIKFRLWKRWFIKVCCRWFWLLNFVLLRWGVNSFNCLKKVCELCMFEYEL